MDLDTLQQQTRFFLSQKITVTVNRYSISTVGSDGTPAEQVAFAQQARFKLREEVTFYQDESRQSSLFGFKARQMIDIGATYDIVDSAGRVIGSFRKLPMQSLLRSTWQLESAGVPPATGAERNAFYALIRRFTDLNFLPYHFDFARDGQSVMSVERQWSIRDQYAVEITDPHIDRRVALAQAVALDALQAR
jgi:uncharacterized protein YxjI